MFVNCENLAVSAERLHYLQYVKLISSDKWTGRIQRQSIPFMVTQQRKKIKICKVVMCCYTSMIEIPSLKCKIIVFLYLIIIFLHGCNRIM